MDLDAPVSTIMSRANALIRKKDKGLTFKLRTDGKANTSYKIPVGTHFLLATDMDDEHKDSELFSNGKIVAMLVPFKDRLGRQSNYMVSFDNGEDNDQIQIVNHPSNSPGVRDLVSEQAAKGKDVMFFKTEKQQLKVPAGVSIRHKIGYFEEETTKENAIKPNKTVTPPGSPGKADPVSSEKAGTKRGAPEELEGEMSKKGKHDKDAPEAMQSDEEEPEAPKPDKEEEEVMEEDPELANEPDLVRPSKVQQEEEKKEEEEKKDPPIEALPEAIKAQVEKDDDVAMDDAAPEKDNAEQEREIEQNISGETEKEVHADENQQILDDQEILSKDPPDEADFQAAMKSLAPAMATALNKPDNDKLYGMLDDYFDMMRDKFALVDNSEENRRDIGVAMERFSRLETLQSQAHDSRATILEARKKEAEKDVVVLEPNKDGGPIVEAGENDQTKTTLANKERDQEETKVAQQVEAIGQEEDPAVALSGDPKLFKAQQTATDGTQLDGDTDQLMDDETAQNNQHRNDTGMQVDPSNDAATKQQVQHTIAHLPEGERKGGDEHQRPLDKDTDVVMENVTGGEASGNQIAMNDKILEHAVEENKQAEKNLPAMAVKAAAPMEEEFDASQLSDSDFLKHNNFMEAIQDFTNTINARQVPDKSKLLIDIYMREVKGNPVLTKEFKRLHGIAKRHEQGLKDDEELAAMKERFNEMDDVAPEDQALEAERTQKALEERRETQAQLDEAQKRLKIAKKNREDLAKELKRKHEVHQHLRLVHKTLAQETDLVAQLSNPQTRARIEEYVREKTDGISILKMERAPDQQEILRGQVREAVRNAVDQNLRVPIKQPYQQKSNALSDLEDMQVHTIDAMSPREIQEQQDILKPWWNEFRQVLTTSTMQRMEALPTRYFTEPFTQVNRESQEKVIHDRATEQQFGEFMGWVIRKKFSPQDGNPLRWKEFFRMCASLGYPELTQAQINWLLTYSMDVTNEPITTFEGDMEGVVEGITPLEDNSLKIAERMLYQSKYNPAVKFPDRNASLVVQTHDATGGATDPSTIARRITSLYPNKVSNIPDPAFSMRGGQSVPNIRVVTRPNPNFDPKQPPGPDNPETITENIPAVGQGSKDIGAQVEAAQADRLLSMKPQRLYAPIHPQAADRYLGHRNYKRLAMEPKEYLHNFAEQGFRETDVVNMFNWNMIAMIEFGPTLYAFVTDQAMQRQVPMFNVSTPRMVVKEFMELNELVSELERFQKVADDRADRVNDGSGGQRDLEDHLDKFFKGRDDAEQQKIADANTVVISIPSTDFPSFEPSQPAAPGDEGGDDPLPGIPEEEVIGGGEPLPANPVRQNELREAQFKTNENSGPDPITYGIRKNMGEVNSNSSSSDIDLHAAMQELYATEKKKTTTNTQRAKKRRIFDLFNR